MDDPLVIPCACWQCCRFTKRNFDSQNMGCPSLVTSLVYAPSIPGPGPTYEDNVYHKEDNRNQLRKHRNNFCSFDKCGNLWYSSRHQDIRRGRHTLARWSLWARVAVAVLARDRGLEPLSSRVPLAHELHVTSTEVESSCVLTSFY